jgi:hypothetical protein
LFVLEAPGPQAVRSGFMSRNNPDETAKNWFDPSRDTGINRRGHSGVEHRAFSNEGRSSTAGIFKSSGSWGELSAELDRRAPRSGPYCRLCICRIQPDVYQPFSRQS